MSTPGEAALGDAVRAVRAGRLIVLPTDTVYGIATRADDPEATGRLFTAKERDSSLGLPVFVATVEEAERVAELDDRARVVARAFWPGPLTVVLRRSKASVAWALGESADTVAIRIPGHPLARALAQAAGPLAVTSANRSGSPVATTGDELLATFGDAVEVYLCEDRPLPVQASTVVDLTDDELRIVREGPIGRDAVEAALRRG